MPVNSWDNHELHIHIHNQFRKTQQFELLPPEIKEGFELHVQTHQLALMGQTIGVTGQPLNEAPQSQGPPANGNQPPEGGPESAASDDTSGEEEESGGPPPPA